MHESFFGNPRTWVGIAFFIFLGIFGKRLWAALAQILDARAARIRAELDEAAKLRQDAEALLKDAETRRQAAIDEAKRLLDGAKAEAERVAAQTAAEVEASAKRREQMAHDRIAAAEKAAVDEVRFAAADVATAAARSVIGTHLSPDADSQLIDHAIAGLPAALSQRQAA